MPSPHSDNPKDLSHLIIQNSLDGVLAYDLELRYTIWNPAMERISGLPAEKVLGRVASEVFPFLKEIGEERYFRIALEGKTGVSRDRPYHIPSSGKQGYFEAVYAPIWSDGRIIGGHGVVRDTTLRVQQEKRGRMAEYRYRLLFEQSPISIQICSPSGRTIAVNQAWKNLMRLPEEFIRDYIFEKYNILDDPLLVESGVDGLIARAFAGEAVEIPPIHYDPSTRGFPGRAIWSSAHAFPVKNEDGSICEVVLIHHDITDFKKVEDELRKAVRIRDEFLSLASHELKTPITAISWQAQLINRYVDKGREVPPEQFHRLADMLRRQLGRLMSLVEDMLDISRITAGRFRVQPHPMDLAGLAREAIERMSSRISQAGCEVDLRLPGPVTGEWDSQRLDQVLSNLLENACRYAAGTKITVVAHALPDGAELMVSDTGPGIRPEDHDKIFERFERGGDAQIEYVSGLGLGLYIVKQIVLAHGGTISVGPTAGDKGATFRIQLPSRS